MIIAGKSMRRRKEKERATYLVGQPAKINLVVGEDVALRGIGAGCGMPLRRNGRGVGLMGGFSVAFGTVAAV